MAMGGGTQCLIAVIAITLIGSIRAEDSDVNNTTGMTFPDCNGSISCTVCTTSEWTSPIRFIQLLTASFQSTF